MYVSLHLQSMPHSHVKQRLGFLFHFELKLVPLGFSYWPAAIEQIISAFYLVWIQFKESLGTNCSNSLDPITIRRKLNKLKLELLEIASEQWTCALAITQTILAFFSVKAKRIRRDEIEFALMLGNNVVYDL